MKNPRQECTGGAVWEKADVFTCGSSSVELAVEKSYVSDSVSRLVDTRFECDGASKVLEGK